MTAETGMAETMVLKAQPIDAESFRRFGDAFDADGAPDMMINDGRCGRYHDRVRLDFDGGRAVGGGAFGGRAGISLFRTRAVALPYALTVMERHPLGSQAFIPMSEDPFLVAVAEDDGGSPGTLHAFLTRPRQGISYLPNTWHAPLMALKDDALFAVVDRIGPGQNLEEFTYTQPVMVSA